jgi:hypothetical protein
LNLRDEFLYEETKLERKIWTLNELKMEVIKFEKKNDEKNYKEK